MAANYSIFGERVARLRKPPLPQPLSVDKFSTNKAIGFTTNRLLRKPVSELESIFQQINNNNDKPKKFVKRKVVKKVPKKKDILPDSPFEYKPKFIPNLPDKILWHIFDLLDYKHQCKAEGVCKRWQKMVRFVFVCSFIPSQLKEIVLSELF